MSVVMYSIPLEMMPKEAQNLPPNEVAYLIKLGLLSQQSMLTPKMIISSAESTFLPSEKNKTAALIGQTGEQIVRDIYEKRYIVENVSKQGRTGDMWIKRNITPQHPIQHQILVEVKNYTSPVGTQEVDKFYRDLSANSSIIGGIFISLNTPIIGIANNFHFTYRSETPVVFVTFNCEKPDEVIMLAADLIWAFVDSKYIVDDQIFQKLSTKLTKLSDCLNNLSMCRTYITETRTMLDKQMSKIYENVLSGELQMRQIIRSINKTLNGGSQESYRGLKFTIQELSPGMLEELINNKFAGSLFNTNDVHKEILHRIIQAYFTCFTDENEIINIDIDKKDIIFRHKHQVLMVLGILKARTDVSFQLYVVPSTLNIMPGIASYVNGMITFQIDKNSATDSSLERILRCIKDMCDQELIGKLDDPTPFDDLDE